MPPLYQRRFGGRRRALLFDIVAGDVVPETERLRCDDDRRERSTTSVAAVRRRPFIKPQLFQYRKNS